MDDNVGSFLAVPSQLSRLNMSKACLRSQVIKAFQGYHSPVRKRVPYSLCVLLTLGIVHILSIWHEGLAIKLQLAACPLCQATKLLITVRSRVCEVQSADQSFYVMTLYLWYLTAADRWQNSSGKGHCTQAYCTEAPYQLPCLKGTTTRQTCCLHLGPCFLLDTSHLPERRLF